ASTISSVSFSLIFYIYFFNWYVHHRDLHSFPTRRSSDLGQRDVRRLAGRGVYRRGVRARGDPVGAGHPDARLAGQAGQLRDERLDRKSTRLNSSHDQISYAVFCLKKKIKPKHHSQYESLI